MFEFLSYILQLFGFSNLSIGNGIVLLLCFVLFFSLGALLSVLNISIYLLSLYVLQTDSLVYNYLLKNKYTFLMKILMYYRSSSVFFITLEVLVLLFSLLCIVRVCLQVLISLNG